MAEEASADKEIFIHALAPGEEPDGGLPRVVIMHALSGEYRIIVEDEAGLHVSGRSRPALPDMAPCDTPEKAVATAREVARRFGLSRVFMREDAATG